MTADPDKAPPSTATSMALPLSPSRIQPPILPTTHSTGAPVLTIPTLTIHEGIPALPSLPTTIASTAALAAAAAGGAAAGGAGDDGAPSSGLPSPAAKRVSTATATAQGGGGGGGGGVVMPFSTSEAQLLHPHGGMGGGGASGVLQNTFSRMNSHARTSGGDRRSGETDTHTHTHNCAPIFAALCHPRALFASPSAT